MIVAEQLSIALWLSVVVLVAIVGVVLVSASSNRPALPAPTQANSAVAQGLPMLTATLTKPSTLNPSATVSPTDTLSLASPVVSPTMTRAVVYASVRFQTNLRAGPGTEYEVLGQVPSEAPFEVLGRDTLGVWLFVNMPGVGEGWIFTNQIKQTLDVLALSVAYLDVLQPSSTPKRSITPASSTQTPTPAIPSSFAITLDMQPTLTSCDQRVSHTQYEVRVTGNSIELERTSALLTGIYYSQTGRFEASASIGVGVTDRMTGTILIENRRIYMEGKVSRTGSIECEGEWDFNSSTLLP